MGCGPSNSQDFVPVNAIPSSRSTWSYQRYRPHHARANSGWTAETEDFFRYNRNFPGGEVNQNGLRCRLRRHLKACSDVHDLARLEEAVEQCRKYSVPPDEDYYTAVRTMEFLKLKRALREGLRRRHAGVLDSAIRDARKSPHADRLRTQIEVAVKLRDHLRELRFAKHDLRPDIDQKTLSEIRSYQQPPDCVVKVMAASCMLIGYTDRIARNWSDVQIVLSRKGRDNPLHLMHEFDPRLVPHHIAERVDALLGRYTLDDVRLASHGVASHHVWALDKLEEVYLLNGWRRKRK